MSITKKHSRENEYLRVIKSIYRKSKSRVKLETDGPWVPIKKDVRQGEAFTYIYYFKPN